MESLVLRALASDNPARRPSRSDLDMNPGLSDVWTLPDDPVPAAVLVPLVRRDEGLHVLLTQRTDHLPTHKGQVAFPGGKIDPTDSDAVDCALRETEEEIGLPRDLVQIVGELDLYRTGTGFAVTPIVGFVNPPFELTPEPGEVEAIFEVPLARLVASDGLERHSREFGGHERYFYAMNWNGFYIWGVTAAILNSFRELVQAVEQEREAG